MVLVTLLCLRISVDDTKIKKKKQQTTKKAVTGRCSSISADVFVHNLCSAHYSDDGPVKLT